MGLSEGIQEGIGFGVGLVIVDRAFDYLGKKDKKKSVRRKTKKVNKSKK